jgi:tyrosine-protein kinase Etk/Wzc
MGRLGDQDVSSNMLWTDPVESEVQQLTTQSVAQYVVDTLALRIQTPGVTRAGLIEVIDVEPEDAVRGEYRLRVESDGSVHIEDASETQQFSGRLGAPVHFAAGVIVVLEGVSPGEYDLRLIGQRPAEAMVSGGLAASTRPETNLIDVTYTGIDPGLTPAILNAVADGLRDLGVRRARDWAQSRTEFIRERLDEAAGDLRAGLQSVQEYKEGLGLSSLSSEEARVLEQMSRLQSQLEQLIIERGIYTSLVEQVRAVGIQPGDIQQFALLSSGQLNRTVQFYYDHLLSLLEDRANQVVALGKDPSHPDIVAIDRRIGETQEDLVEASGNAASAIDLRVDGLTRSLSSLRAELRQLPGVETELASKEGQVEIFTDTYKYLLARYQESQIAEAEISPYVEVLDPAQFSSPVSGGRRINILLGGFLGLLLGVVAAFLLEHLDRSVQTSSDIESNLGIAVLGWIPKMAPDAEGRPVPLVAITDPEGSAAEAYRVLRTNIAFSTSREQLLSSLVFTSPGPEEGKSTTVANLSAVLAARGDRALLIDADLRRGELHEAFDLLRSPGLSDLLVGQLDARETIRPQVRPGLDLLPAGKRPPNPSELLGSQAMAKLLAAWREEYRWVLLDAPPVLAVTDAAVLAALVDGTVLVLRAGETDRRAAWRSVQQLERVDARVVGAVLNEVKGQGPDDGYYLDYYYARPESS